MLFNSIEFLIFFIVVTVSYFLLPYRFRWILLLAASFIFYMFFIPIYVLILVFTIIIDYIAGILIYKSEKRKHFWLVLSLIANIGVLAYFKYYNFFIENINTVISFMGQDYQLPLLGLILPIGLSFHTFQAMSYTIEVYRGNQLPEKHFGKYALYVMYYPQLVAGPIERPQQILHQLSLKYDFDYHRVTSGLRLMLWGLFKKVVIADRLTKFVDIVYGDVTSYQGFPLIWATIFFAIQIYCDFSGYTDIAIGASRVMGVKLMKNFNRPYLSTSISEFWRRWHISLSTWFTDYLYTPLLIKIRDLGLLGIVIAIMVTFFTSGLWHGAGWTFIIWGLVHGVALSIEALTAKRRKKILKKIKQPIALKSYQFMSWIVTMTIVLIGYVFFRAESIADAKYLWANFYKLNFSSLIGVPNFSIKTIVLMFLLIAFVFASDWIKEKAEKHNYQFFNKPAFRNVSVFLMLLGIYLFGVFGNQNFIYFQF